jgi:hypothetical protein
MNADVTLHIRTVLEPRVEHQPVTVLNAFEKSVRFPYSNLERYRMQDRDVTF